MIDPLIISLVIEEEKARKKLERMREYGIQLPLYEEVYEEEPSSVEDTPSPRGVVVIDI